MGDGEVGVVRSRRGGKGINFIREWEAPFKSGEL